MTRPAAFAAMLLALLSAGPSPAETARRPAPQPVALTSLPNAEIEVFRLAVVQCWNLGALPAAALQGTVTLETHFDPKGRPVADGIRMLSFTGGNPVAAEQLFASARRALLRCGANGLPLPTALQHRTEAVQMTFDPTGARLR